MYHSIGCHVITVRMCSTDHLDPRDGERSASEGMPHGRAGGAAGDGDDGRAARVTYVLRDRSGNGLVCCERRAKAMGRGWMAGQRTWTRRVQSRRLERVWWFIEMLGTSLAEARQKDAGCTQTAPDAALEHHLSSARRPRCECPSLSTARLLSPATRTAPIVRSLRPPVTCPRVIALLRGRREVHVRQSLSRGPVPVALAAGPRPPRE
ncbi:hypothetical protein L226DRAFT_86582 [Lentinus tigrinus ALCF2SS1-7]|uniref:uncharacterized protein n=1 Tax=Lentinus tigrinus ALCF2SS1-7 TaxID=1328758 RepID=UPI0011662AFE|nr:hypothetical protein L226DRAFT_86582 [Lentinus tigrinus ALCF2SS1-7]